ncbi:hypothetical protein PAMA_001712 [Pampus argenteus]
MSSETTGQTMAVTTEEAADAATGSVAVKGDRKCPVSDQPIFRDDVIKVWKECQEESFWYRALPFSLGSMAITGGLIYNGIWKSSKRFGPFSKLAVAGILGYAVGKASYVGTCRGKFQQLGLVPGRGLGPWSQGGPFGPNSHPGYRSCHHVCDECKKTAQASPAEQVKS